ncbi:MAG: CIA30 family protein [Pseudohongiella sp.]|uniref:CIA30 family protein n=1 Tax=Pseudohongiella sp. TaxID=1979412 RepID=UPI0034A01BCB
MPENNYAAVSLMDFSDPACAAKWHAINDGVMGGQSRGGPHVIDGQLHFTGCISLANNGGFASIRARQQHHDLSSADSVLLRVKGDGRSYQFRLYTSAHVGSSRIAYATTFKSIDNAWLELRLGFSQLKPTIRGRTLSGPAFNPAGVEEIGFLLADKSEGDFHLCIDWIKTI